MALVGYFDAGAAIAGSARSGQISPDEAMAAFNASLASFAGNVSAAAATNCGPGFAAAAGPPALGPADVVVIGKLDDLGVTTLRPGERVLQNHLHPDLGSTRLNYVRNDRVLRAEMRRGVPIRDVTVDPVSGNLWNSTGFLRAERNVLTNHGWGFDPKSGYWYPPGW